MTVTETRLRTLHTWTIQQTLIFQKSAETTLAHAAAVRNTRTVTGKMRDK